VSLSAITIPEQCEQDNRSVGGALNAIAGYESMHMIRKGQIRWLAKG
jgi:hypothetical protein